MKLDPANLGRMDCYKLLSGSIVPRPIGFISTISETGIPNVAPFSWFTAVCSYPPMVCFNVERGGAENGKKHTLLNIEAVGDFVVNMVDYDLGPAMVAASANWPREMSEFNAAGLTSLQSDKVRSPRVAESPISFECRLKQVIEFGGQQSWLVIGEVVQFHVRDDLYYDGKINLHLLKPLGRMAGVLYCYTHDTFEMRPPEWDKATTQWARDVGYFKEG
ncbi:MAG: flavin reductase family protein [Chloroflexi bacterium]|nr:flavin reductase family protein [Chloroflexota bacterium]